MLLPETKEREYRFRLALRMGLPIFALILALISNTLITTYENLQVTFYFESILLLAFSIYFILYLIYKGFDVRITEEVSKTFTREYLYKYLKKRIAKEKDYTLILISIDNLNDINSRYGIKNGDKVIYEVAKYVNEYLQTKNIYNFPMGHIKGGDFVLGLKGKREQYNTMLELLCLKSDEFKVDEIEVNISGAITDTTFSNDLDYMIENLFELQEENKNQKLAFKNEEINPSELEFSVVSAVKNRNFILTTQSVFEADKSVIKECSVKLKMEDGRYIHQKKYMKILAKLGLSVAFDLMVFEKVVTLFENIDEVPAINISPTSLRNPLFLRRVVELLKGTQEVQKRVIFILSEQEYYSQIEKFNALLKTYRDAGILITIDKLGALHSSFLYLRDLDIDIVRFDLFLTKEMKKRNYHSIMDGFNSMAHDSGIKTWIKMIETQEIKEEAKRLKIDYLQGKYLCEVEKIYEK